MHARSDLGMLRRNQFIAVLCSNYSLLLTKPSLLSTAAVRSLPSMPTTKHWTTDIEAEVNLKASQNILCSSPTFLFPALGT